MVRDYSQSLGECLKHWRLRKGMPLETLAIKTRIPLKYLRALEADDSSNLPPIDTAHHTMGNLLRGYREQQGLSLDNIAEQTRIPLSYLKALEENDALQMPNAPVIARSFVDAYLNCLSLEHSQKEEVLIQFAKLAEAVYNTPDPESVEESVHMFEQASSTWRTSTAALSNHCHEWALAIYWKVTTWRAASCQQIMATVHALSAWCHALGTWSGEFSQGVKAMFLTVGPSVYYTILRYAGRIWTGTCTGMNQLALWHHARQMQRLRTRPTRQALLEMPRDRTQPSIEWYHIVTQSAENEATAPDTRTSHINHAPPMMGVKIWAWMVRYGMTILLLLLLGSTAANIPLFKEIALIEAKLDASHLIEFFGYGGALIMVWLMSRKAAVLLDRDRSGLAFLRPMVGPLTALLITSGSYKIALVLMNPFLSKADRLAYNWTCAFLILASTLWVILTWFFQAAPLLESLEAASRDKQPVKNTGSSGCPHCGAFMPAGMQFCGRCGIAYRNDRITEVSRPD